MTLKIRGGIPTSTPNPQRTNTQFSPCLRVPLSPQGRGKKPPATHPTYNESLHNSHPAYASPSPLKGEGISCHAELVSASLFRPAESRPRRSNYSESPAQGFLRSHPHPTPTRPPSPLKGEVKEPSATHPPTTKASTVFTLTRRSRVPLSPQGRGKKGVAHRGRREEKRGSVQGKGRGEKGVQPAAEEKEEKQLQPVRTFKGEGKKKGSSAQGKGGGEKRDDAGTEHLSEGRKKRRRTERRDNAQGVKRHAGRGEKMAARRGKGGGKRGKKTGTRGRRERGKKSNDRDRY